MAKLKNINNISMSNINLIATQKDNNQYDIKTISNNLSWVLPNSILDSSPSTPVTWKQLKQFRNLATSCIGNQQVTTPSGSVSACDALYEQILLVNPGAKVPIIGISSKKDISMPPKEIPEPPKEIPEPPGTTSDNTMYIFIGLFVLIIIIGIVLMYYHRKKKHSNNFSSQSDTTDTADIGDIGEDPEMGGGFFNRGE